MPQTPQARRGQARPSGTWSTQAAARCENPDGGVTLAHESDHILDVQLARERLEARAPHRTDEHEAGLPHGREHGGHGAQNRTAASPTPTGSRPRARLRRQRDRVTHAMPERDGDREPNGQGERDRDGNKRPLRRIRAPKARRSRRARHAQR